MTNIVINHSQNLSGHDTILHSLSINNDDVMVSCGDNGSVKFWDWKTGYNFQTLQTRVQPGDWCGCVTVDTSLV